LRDRQVYVQVREDLLNNVFLNTFVVAFLYGKPNDLTNHTSCQDNVHGNVRLAFHDAAGFSQALLEAGEFPFVLLPDASFRLWLMSTIQRRWC
jgi:hypothetical protein